MAVYRIDQFLGEGGFAYVYRARDTNLDIDVALKVLKPAFAYDEVFEENFRREAHRAAKFRHPNVVAIHYAGKDDNIVFFSMDLLERGLKDLLHGKQPVGEEMILKVGSDVASALQFAHTHEGGIVHRDLKPDNILFDRHGNAVVTDFGIAEAATHYTAATGTTVYVGTPIYMSPEQARGHRVDHRSDIYSLGVTLYEMATGQPPFYGRDWFELGRKHIEELPALPREKNLALDPDLERIILKCLQKNPADRYQSAEHLGSDLHTLMTGSRPNVVINGPTAERKRAEPAEPAEPASAPSGAQPPGGEAQSGPFDLYGAPTRPPRKRRRGLKLLALVALLGGAAAAYATDTGGIRTYAEEQLPILATVPYIGTGSVYPSSFSYAAEGGGAHVEHPRLNIRFNAPIDAYTATRANVRLSGPAGRQIPAEIDVRDGNRQITVVPTERLQYETGYTIRIAGDLLSAKGTPIFQNPRADQPGAVFTFRTRRPPPDKTPPVLMESTPTNNGRDVAPGDPITLVFSEPLDLNTVTGANVKLYDESGDAVPIDVLLRPEDQRTAQIQPRAALERGSRYELHLLGGILDRAGNSLVLDTVTFTTVAARARPADPPTPGRLSVRVLPAQAVPLVKIELDGQVIGNPPKLNLSVSAGVRHTVRLLGAPAYSSHALPLHEESFMLRSGQTREIVQEIQPFGWITLNAEPAADVFVDGKYVGSAPIAGYAVYAGPHKLELHPASANGGAFTTLEREIEVPPFRELNLGSLQLPRR